MTRVNLKGIIVSSHYDTDWAQKYIDKGLITPQSKFERDLAAVNDDAEIYINSPGGDVFAGYQMVNVANEWRAKTGKKLSVVVGAMAASAAANFVVSVNADIVTAHANSKFMIHGAFCATSGGSQAHEDTAALLEKINGETRLALVTRHGIDQATADEWFAEGREGWLSATEAKAAKLVDGILEEQSPSIRFPAAAVAAMRGHGMQIAACADIDEEPPAATTTEPANVEIQDAPAVQGDKPPASGDGQDDGDAGDGLAGGSTDELAAALARIEADHAAEIAAMSELHAAEIVKRDALIAKLQSAADKAKAELAELQKIHATAMETHAAEVGSLRSRLDRFLSPATSLQGSSIETWEQALAAHDGDYAEARRQHPDIFAAAFPNLKPKK